jgi:hypothetical protein
MRLRLIVHVAFGLCVAFGTALAAMWVVWWLLDVTNVYILAIVGAVVSFTVLTVGDWPSE